MYILKAEKLAKKTSIKETAYQIAMAQLNLFNAVEKTASMGKEAIIYFSEGDEQRMLLMGLKRFTKYVNTPNPIALRKLIAEKIIFCDGLNTMNNPYFKALPFVPNKGEALIVKIKGLAPTNIYKTNITIVPWNDDLFWVGSSYEWSFTNALPTESFKEKMITALDAVLKQPYEVVDHLVGIRPANTERRPFVGLHPKYPQLGICNGMGTKGCSLAPYFAKQLIDHIEQGSIIEPEADIKRFASILSN